MSALEVNKNKNNEVETGVKQSHTYDEAVELTGHGSYNRLVLLTCSVISIAVGMDMFGHSVAVAGAACDLQLDMTTTGLLSSSPFVGVFFAFPWGYYADTSGRRRALLLSTTVGFIMAALTSLAPNWQSMLACKVIGCCFSTAAFTLTMTYLGECTGHMRRSRYMLIMNSANLASEMVFYSLAFFILPLDFNAPIPWLGIDFRPWRLYILIVAIPLGIGSLLIFFLHESPKFLANKGDVGNALDVLKKIYVINGGEKDAYPVLSILLENEQDHTKRTFWESIVKQTVPLFRPPLLWRTLQLFYLMSICCCTNNVFIMWYPMLVNMFFNSYSGGTPVGDSSFCQRVVANISAIDEENYTCDDSISHNTIYAGILMGLIFMSLNLLASIVARWRRLVLISFYLLSAICLVIVNHVRDPVGTLIVFTLVQTTAIGIGCVAGYFVDLYPTSFRGLVTSLGMMAARIAALSGVNMVGATVVDHCSFTFYLFAVYVFRFGRFNLVIILLSIGVILAMAFETFSVSYLVPASACELQTTNFQQGLMAGMPLFGILAGSNLLGYMADTRGRRKTLLWALSFGYISGSLATLSPNWIAFSFLKFLSSSAMAGSYGLGVSYLSECTPESKRSSIVILITSAFLVSVGTMAALTIPVLALTFSYYVPYLDIHFNGWRLLNLIYATPCLLCAISLYFAFESPKFYLSTGQGDKALEIMKKMFVINTGRSSENFKVQEVYLEEDCASSLAKGFWGSIAAQTTPLLKPPLLKNTLLLSVLFVAVYFCFNPYTVWLPYMADGFMKSLEKGERGLTFCQMLRSSENDTTVRDPESTADCALNAKAMTLVLAIDLLLAVINIVLAAIKHWVSRKTLLIGVQMSAGVAGLGLVFCNIWQLTAVLLVTYVAGNLNFGILSTFSVDIFPTYVKAMGVCLTLMVGRGSAVFSISLLKSMLVSNCEGSFYLYTCITFFGGLIGLLLPGEKQKVNKKNDAEANTIGAT